jgi:hypothetical protein
LIQESELDLPWEPELVTTTSGQIAATSATTGPVDLSQTFWLNSLAGANQTIYLDFDGHTTSGTYWNSGYKAGADIITPAYSFEGDSTFSNAELERIQYIWRRVAEDFMPFNVNVTTQAPTDINDLIKSGSNDTRWGIRVAIGGSSYDWFAQGAGGVAYMGSFNWNSDTPTFVFEEQLGNGNEKYTAEAISHEVGHTLGLNHDGRISPSEGYYGGHGSGDTGWATIMGVGYYKNLSQWSKGEYTSANNTEDDLAIITNATNGFGYRADDTGNTISTAKALTVAGNAIGGSGMIERNTDVDFYSFLTNTGTISLNVNPVTRGTNLDILAELYSVDGTLIASSNSSTALAATISTSVTAGSYYLKIDGVGTGDPLTTGYTDYGSLGQYFISGTVVGTSLPGISLALAPTSVLEDGTNNLVYTFSRTGDLTNALTVRYNVAGTATLGTDYSQSGADSFTSTEGTITFAAGTNTATLTIDPNADILFEDNETVALTLATDPSYLLLTAATVTGTITNDDTPVITLALAPTSVLEDGTNNLVYTFTRTADTTNALTVKYNVGGTAILDSDYTQTGAISFTSTTGTITFAEGASTATLTIDPTADTFIEGNETVALALVADTGYIVGTTTAVTGTITNDDIPVITLAVAPSQVREDGAENLLYTFSRAGDITNPLTVNYRISGSATVANGDYTQTGATSFSGSTGTITFAAGASTAVLTIDPTADTTIENNETVGITLSSNANYSIGTTTTVTGTITDDDRPVITLALAASSVLEDSLDNLVYTFTRTADTTNPLTVNYRIAGTATVANGDYSQTGAATFGSTTGTITFAAGANTATLTIDPTADGTLENNETVALTITSGSNYTIGTTTAVTGTIADDDTPVITLDVAPASVLEDGIANLVYTFTRTTNPANALTVRYSVGGTATLNTDYTQTGAASFRSTSGTITFAAGSNTATLTIDPKTDTTIESDETVILSLQTGTGYRVGTTAAVTGTITNDEVSGASVFLEEDPIPTPLTTTVSPEDETTPTPIATTAIETTFTPSVRGLTLDLSEIVLPTTKVEFTIEREAKYNNSVGFYQTLDTEGSIQTSNGILKPTDAGYIQAALDQALANARELGLNLATQNQKTTQMSFNLEKAFYMPILVADGTLAEAAQGKKLKATYTAFGSANPDKVEHIKSIGFNTFGFEDTFGGGDRDYDDLIIKTAMF